AAGAGADDVAGAGGATGFGTDGERGEDGAPGDGAAGDRGAASGEEASADGLDDGSWDDEDEDGGEDEAELPELAPGELPPQRNTYTFHDEKVLIVDDDVRNVFALTSMLEENGLSVLYAENGREGIEVLEQHDEVRVVLMDIMMPEMDGYATTTAIRRMPQFAGLPIVALTAKAMKGDREKAIDSGASDYVTKPVDPDRLLTALEKWLRTK
ncbi:response regulator, partial [Streptomyces sp. SID11385]|uniref:response regulator n=1 Tax=Streptomyces sp. SID11385 TaxID=2706031 RepID=UPI001EF3A22F